MFFRACPNDGVAVKQKLSMRLDRHGIPEKFVSVGGGHLSQVGQNFVVIGVALLGHMLQNLPDLHTNSTVLIKFLHGSTYASIHITYHVLPDVIILRHLNKRLKQPAMVLDKNLACLPITPLEETVTSVEQERAVEGAYLLKKKPPPARTDPEESLRSCLGGTWLLETAGSELCLSGHG